MEQIRLGVIGALAATLTFPAAAMAETGAATPTAPSAEPAPLPGTPGPSDAAPPSVAPPAEPSEPPPTDETQATSASVATDASAEAAIAAPAELPPEPASVPVEDPELENPSKVAVGDEGFIKFGALLQFWGFMSSVDDETTTTFRLRRAEVKLAGDIIPKLISYKLMIDPAGVLESRSTTIPVEGQEPEPTDAGTVTVAQPTGRTAMLNDFVISFKSEYTDLSVGQFKNGVSYEGFHSSSELILPERSPVARAFGDKRDIGLSLSKEFDYFNYFVAVLNGAGANLRDNNNQKDLAARVELLPVDGLLVGLVGYTSIGERDEPTTTDLFEVDLRLDMANVMVQGLVHSGEPRPQRHRSSGPRVLRRAGLHPVRQASTGDTNRAARYRRRQRRHRRKR